VIEIRKLAAIDMAWLGARVIVAEYALGVILPLGLGMVSIRSAIMGSVKGPWPPALGIWLVGIAVNYIPLLIYALLIARAGTAREEGGPELSHARRYGVQQVIILIPLVVAILALAQERRRMKAGQRRS
jgi:hypothetical protein